MTEPTEEQLARLLPGVWSIGATNFPMWLRGDRLAPTFGYELQRESPLVLGDTVTYFTREGAEKSIRGVDRFRHGEFSWRGRGVLWLFRSRWRIAGIDDERRFAVVRFSRTLATPAGVDIIVPQGSDAGELRRWVAEGATSVGLTTEDFASMSWLELGGA
ncbi:MAG: hypothetical protein JWN36_2721 [Microbacteriaceae bacterium]|nr:hypothetical protein [Microbacteriaceae bacterium]